MQSDDSTSKHDLRAMELQRLIDDAHFSVKETENRCDQYRLLMHRTAEDRDKEWHKMQAIVEVLDTMLEDQGNLIQFYHETLAQKENSERRLGSEVAALDAGRTIWDHRLQQTRKEARRLDHVNAKAKEAQTRRLQARAEKKEKQKKLMVQEEKHKEILYNKAHSPEIIDALETAENIWSKLSAIVGHRDMTSEEIASKYQDIKQREKMVQELLDIAIKRKQMIELQLQQPAEALSVNEGQETAPRESSEAARKQPEEEFEFHTTTDYQSNEAEYSGLLNQERPAVIKYACDAGNEAQWRHLQKTCTSADLSLTTLNQYLQAFNHYAAEHLGTCPLEQEADEISSKNIGSSLHEKHVVDGASSQVGAREPPTGARPRRGSIVTIPRRMSACDVTAARSTKKRGSIAISSGKSARDDVNMLSLGKVNSQSKAGSQSMEWSSQAFVFSGLITKTREVRQNIVNLISFIQKNIVPGAQNQQQGRTLKDQDTRLELGTAGNSYLTPCSASMINGEKQLMTRDVSIYDIEANSSPEASDEKPMLELKQDEIKLATDSYEACNNQRNALQVVVPSSLRGSMKLEDDGITKSSCQESPQQGKDGLMDSYTVIKDNPCPPDQVIVSKSEETEYSAIESQCFAGVSKALKKQLKISDCMNEEAPDIMAVISNTQLGSTTQTNSIISQEIEADFSAIGTLQEIHIQNGIEHLEALPDGCTQQVDKYFQKLLGSAISPAERAFDPFIVQETDNDGDEILDRLTLKHRAHRILAAKKQQDG